MPGVGNDNNDEAVTSAPLPSACVRSLSNLRITYMLWLCSLVTSVFHTLKKTLNHIETS